MDYEVQLEAPTAWRAFEVRGDHLWSTGYGRYEWQPGPNEAFCDQVGRERGKPRKVWQNDPLDPAALVERRIEAGEHGRIPSPACECGFYAYRTQASALRHFGSKVVPGLSTRVGLGHFGTDVGVIVGRVQLWGRIIVGRDGYRAQFARITALVSEEPEAVADLLERYGVPMLRPAEGITTGYITSRAEDPSRIRLQTVTEDLGWYAVSPGIALPDYPAEVTVEHEEREGVRWITSLHEERE